MIGMDLKVTMDDGSEHIAPITYAVACAWEDHHPGKAAASMFDPIQFKQIVYLAYEALRKSKITVKVWPQFIDTLEDVQFIPKERQEKDQQPST